VLTWHLLSLLSRQLLSWRALGYGDPLGMGSRGGDAFAGLSAGPDSRAQNLLALSFHALDFAT